MSEQTLHNSKLFDEIADLLLPEVCERARGQSQHGQGLGAGASLSSSFATYSTVSSS